MRHRNTAVLKKELRCILHMKPHFFQLSTSSKTGDILVNEDQANPGLIFVDVISDRYVRRNGGAKEIHKHA
jgi:hypothetical protein